MRIRFFHVLLPPLILVLASFPASAQEALFSQKKGVALPTDADIARAQQRTREMLEKLPDSKAALQQYGSPTLPKVDSLPKPAAPAPDIASIAQKYQQLGAVKPNRGDKTNLMVFVSLSMPKEALVRTAEQAERAGATLVFRGLKGDSMTKMGEEVQKILGGRNVSVAIHPPAFQQFSVTRVPAIVMARPEAGNVLGNGCSKPETFVKVSGDVSLDYALDYIERKSPAWAAVARYFRSKIVRGIN